MAFWYSSERAKHSSAAICGCFALSFYKRTAAWKVTRPCLRVFWKSQAFILCGTAPWGATRFWRLALIKPVSVLWALSLLLLCSLCPCSHLCLELSLPLPSHGRLLFEIHMREVALTCSSRASPSIPLLSYSLCYISGHMSPGTTRGFHTVHISLLSRVDCTSAMHRMRTKFFAFFYTYFYLDMRKY